MIAAFAACENPADSPGYYVGSKESNVFHVPDCRYVKQITATNKITFNSSSEAINAGYRPCSVCNP